MSVCRSSTAVLRLFMSSAFLVHPVSRQTEGVSSSFRRPVPTPTPTVVASVVQGCSGRLVPWFLLKNYFRLEIIKFYAVFVYYFSEISIPNTALNFTTVKGIRIK